MLWKGIFHISKRQHVESYTNHAILKPATRMFAKGLFDTVFRCSRGQIFVLRINCRADPILVMLYGCVAVHPLIDNDMHVRITYHDARLLGDAVMDTILQMQLSPPNILRFTEDAVEALQDNIANPVPNRGPDPNPENQRLVWADAWLVNE